MPVSRSTVFDAASLAKQFTGLAVAILVRQGKIRLTDDVRTYLPEFPDLGQRITIDHLLHHTSGLRDWAATLSVAGWQLDAGPAPETSPRRPRACRPQVALNDISDSVNHIMYRDTSIGDSSPKLGSASPKAIVELLDYAGGHDQLVRITTTDDRQVIGIRDTEIAVRLTHICAVEMA